MGCKRCTGKWQMIQGGKTWPWASGKPAKERGMAWGLRLRVELESTELRGSLGESAQALVTPSVRFRLR